MTQRQLLTVLLIILGVSLVLAGVTILGAAHPLVDQFK